MSAPATRRARRPILAAAAVVIGLSAVGTGTGMALGAVATASSDGPDRHHHRGTVPLHDDPRTR